MLAPISHQPSFSARRTNRLSFPRSPAVPGLDFDPMASDQSPTFYLGMIFFENRFPLFGIML
jgi:hypothetical protein